ncbi:hypothetical protein DN402_34185 [Streptomyces sp. SW4]|nr:hypothetical protein DN402_34185 [Streptomyces sp. SW4]
MPSTTDVTAEVLAALHLPQPEALTADQRRGAVWGPNRSPPKPPSTSASTIGEHPSPAGRWWPRACHQHASRWAQRALLDHAPACDDCRGPAPCEVR